MHHGENVPLSLSLFHNFSTLLCCPLTFIGTIHPVSQIQQGGVFQQSSNKSKKENCAFPGCDSACTAHDYQGYCWCNSLTHYYGVVLF